MDVMSLAVSLLRSLSHKAEDEDAKAMVRAADILSEYHASNTLFKDKHGNTVEPITMGKIGTKKGKAGQWFIPRHPSGVVMTTLENPWGWVKTPAELAERGIDLETLTEYEWKWMLVPKE